MTLFQKIIKGLASAFILNFIFLYASVIKRRKVVVFALMTPNQEEHIRSIVKELNRDGPFSVRVLKNRDLSTASIYAVPFLVFYKTFVSVEQRMIYPKRYFSTQKRVCLFHGLPSKGNAIEKISKNIDVFCSYGRLHTDYLIKKGIPQSKIRETGQPLTDAILASSKRQRKNQKILIAPSYEKWNIFSQISMEQFATLASEFCITIKPHPTSFRSDFSGLVYEHFEYSSWRSEFINKYGDLMELPSVWDDAERIDLNEYSLVVTDQSGIIFNSELLGVPTLRFFVKGFWYSRFTPEEFQNLHYLEKVGIFTEPTVETFPQLLDFLRSQNLSIKDNNLNTKTVEILFSNIGRATQGFIEGIL